MIHRGPDHVGLVVQRVLDDRRNLDVTFRKFGKTRMGADGQTARFKAYRNDFQRLYEGELGKLYQIE